MKRFLITILILVSCIVLVDLLLSLPALVAMFRALARGDHVVVSHFTLHSDGRLLLDISVLLVLGAFSYWLSGRLIKGRERHKEALNPQ